MKNKHVNEEWKKNVAGTRVHRFKMRVGKPSHFTVVVPRKSWLLRFAYRSLRARPLEDFKDNEKGLLFHKQTQL